ncbi:MAG: PH domain-containing protein [Ignavibacteria bacterium]|nr:PH domain-containing protein [Ignavibacteria bacterium]
MFDDEPIILKAEFNPIVKTYIILYIFGLLCITIIGIPFAVIWICGVGQWFSKHFYEKMFCALTEKHLRFRMGILFTVDKTIPLENIQDLTFYEGPVLRYFNLAMLKVETAGQAEHSGNQMRLIGIIDAHNFRKHVLNQREIVKLNMTAANKNNPQVILLEKISASLERIEANLKK